jgi:hypothetical protein
MGNSWLELWPGRSLSARNGRPTVPHPPFALPPALTNVPLPIAVYRCPSPPRSPSAPSPHRPLSFSPRLSVSFSSRPPRPIPLKSVRVPDFKQRHPHAPTAPTPSRAPPNPSLQHLSSSEFPSSPFPHSSHSSKQIFVFICVHLWPICPPPSCPLRGILGNLPRHSRHSPRGTLGRPRPPTPP